MHSAAQDILAQVADEDVAELLEDLIDWSLKQTPDGASCRICERLHAPTCPIAKAYDLLGLKPWYPVRGAEHIWRSHSVRLRACSSANSVR